jgi:hypothetical protein
MEYEFKQKNLGSDLAFNLRAKQSSLISIQMKRSERAPSKTL